MSDAAATAASTAVDVNADLEDARDRVSRLLHLTGPLDVEEVLAELQTLSEELRVSGEEIEVQQQHIAELLASRQDVAQMLVRMGSSLGAAVVTTDGNAMIIAVNDAGRTLLGLGSAPAPKALAGIAQPQARQQLRGLTSRAMSDESSEPVTDTLTLQLQDGRVLDAQVTVLRQDAPHRRDTRLHWFLLPAQEPAALDRTVVRLLAQLSTVPVNSLDPAQILQRSAPLVAEALGSAVHVTVTVGDPRRPEVLASDSTTAQHLDAAQLLEEEGPCVDAFVTGHTVVTTDVRTDPRWPRLVRRLGPADTAEPVVAVPLRMGQDVIGVLNGYPSEALSAEIGLRPVAERGELLAEAMGVLLGDAQRFTALRDEAEHLRRALVSRPHIDLAKGIIMARYGCDEEAAFAWLARTSRNRNMKLREVANRRVEATRRGGQPDA